MLRIEQSNRLEWLAESLIGQLKALETEPLSPRWVVVPNPGMGRWLVQRMAEKEGIAANLELPLPASFFWRVLRAWLPQEEVSPFDRDILVWRIRSVLPDLLEEPEFGGLRRYLSANDAELRLYQLAGRIADVFDQYLVFRPELVLAWEEGREEHGWQSRLWQAVTREAKGHRARLLMRLIEAMDGAPTVTEKLPATIFFFGLNSLPPAYLEILKRLAEYRDIRFHHLNPCREYWADIRDRRSLEHHDHPQEAFLELGNPLLASLGHVGQVFLDQLLSVEAEFGEHFGEPDGEDVLSRLQGDILELRDGRQEPWPLPEEDWPSLQFHGTHSRYREVQVLQDNLLRCFEEFEGLAPRDVLVMAPDMAAYAPFIEAIFGSVEGKRYIPFAIGDRGAGDEPLAEAIRWLLNLPDSRFPASEVLALLEVDAVQRRFQLDGEALERIRTWVRESGIRWGLDGNQRKELGLPAAGGLHSWRFGLRRLFTGYVTPVDEGKILYPDGSVPYPDIEGGDLLWAGALQEVVERLDHWRSELQQPRSPTGWQQLLSGMLEAFFDPRQEPDILLLQGVRNRLDTLAEQSGEGGFGGTLPLSVMRELLEQGLADIGSSTGFLEGGVTFSNLLPMRALPYRVICLLGMNDTDFPRRQSRPSFDLMAAKPKRADRDRRRDDRYLFLETLVSARDCLIISWQSRDARSNRERLPAEMVSELMDYLDERFTVEGTQPASLRLWTQHPLQPFNPAYFDGSDPRLFSHDPAWMIERTGQEERPFAGNPLDVADFSPEVELEALLQFFRKPAEAFLRQSLQMRVPREDELIQDREPFVPGSLGSWNLKDRLLTCMVEGDDLEREIRVLQAEGVLPQSVPGEFAQRENLEPIVKLHERLKPILEEHPSREPLSLDLEIGEFHLTGRVPGYTGKGLLDYRVGKLRGDDALTLWIRHLAVAAQQGESGESLFLSEDKPLRLGVIHREAAREHLARLLALYRQGLREPLRFAPRTAWALVRNRKNWRGQWEGTMHSRGEGEDNAYRLVARGIEFLDEDFQSNARIILGPLLEYRVEEIR